MIDISLSTIYFYSWALVVWLVDSFLNWKLAKKMGDENRGTYFVPLFSYYRFGVYTGMNRAIVLTGLVTSIVAAFWFSWDISFEIVIISKIVSIIINAVIISRAAEILMKSKTAYVCISIILGLIWLCAEISTAFLVENYETDSMILFLLLLQVIFVQTSKVLLIANTLNYKVQKN